MTLPDFALHITWTCYGTWLPGDERGYVSPTFTPDSYVPRQNVLGLAPAADAAATRDRARRLQKQTTVWLTPGQAVRVAETLVTAARARRWRVLRAAVMPNHVHVVVAGSPNDGPVVRRILKGTTQAALSRHAGQPRTWWTEGGSDRYKNDLKTVENAVEYVANQERKLAEVIDMMVYVPGGGQALPRG